RDRRRDREAPVRSRDRGERPAHRTDPGRHPGDPAAPADARRDGRVGCGRATVHLEGVRRGAVVVVGGRGVEGDDDEATRRVTGGVGEGFLQHPVQDHTGRLVDPVEVAGDLPRDVDPRLPGALQGRFDLVRAYWVDGRRVLVHPQHAEETADLVERFAGGPGERI